MDESHLNAPAVHGNTADLPTNLLTPDYRRVGPIYDVMLWEAAFGRLQPHPGQA